MEFRKCTSFSDAPPASMGTINFLNKGYVDAQIDHQEPADYDSSMEVDVDLQEIYFLIMHFLSAGPCQKTFRQLSSELLEHKLLPRRYHAWYSRTGAAIIGPDTDDDDGTSFHLNYDTLVGRYPHIKKNHLLKLLKQLMFITSPPLRCTIGSAAPTAADVPTLLGTGSFSLLSGRKNEVPKQAGGLPSYLRWPHMQADQVRGLRLREVGGGFPRHHRAPSIRLACYAIAKPSVVVPKMQNKKKLRGHRDAVYCAIFDRTGRYVITGSDDRLVKIWSMQTAFCLASCRGHEGDVTDLSVSSNNALVASASNDFTIRVWRVPDGLPISVLRGHTGAVTAIAFCPRPNAFYQLLSSSDDGTCRVWESRSSNCRPRLYLPKPTDVSTAKNNGFPSASGSSSSAVQHHQILCCAYNVDGTVFVTGSSDTFARVWNACKPTSDDRDLPIHEIDILAGHENDVNYVQFSGCAVSSRSSPFDFSVEDSFPKFKTSWYSHDNIVTCSRDGSAIIWIPRSQRSHGKSRRWVRAYHLKVPPPPMPPQPPRGGPRQRLLPTPRGVNMIVWSLDNRFVLAAIMDNRICVWNANDGSLVHSLAGHTASTYVLDVHPFNPRIAMSAGYDGKTILWDIWEGTPIRVYEIDGRFKLVDGKFSQDGTSIVLSDDVGQIYLLNTGEGESQKDAKYDQFFLGDYRPLIQDAQGNVVDQETQLMPYWRNIQDALCDSSMLPYPEPYQSMYQKRRLGAIGIEWRSSSIKFAVGTDIGIGQEFQILPLTDFDVAIEPLPDYLDALHWEPEYDIMNDDNDSEYNVTEECVSDEPMCATDTASSDTDCSEEGKILKNKKESSRRSKRKKPLQEVASSSSRLVKKRISDEDGTSSRSKRSKKSKPRLQGNSRRKYPKSKSLRPQRVAARNAVNSLSQAAKASICSTDEEDDYTSAGDTDSESSSGHTENLFNEKMKYTGVTEVFSDGCDATAVRPPEHADKPIYSENRKKLVLKFSLNRKNPSTSESQMSQSKSQASANTSSEENPENERVKSRPYNPESSSTSMVDKELSETYLMRPVYAEKPTEADDDLGPSTSCSVPTANWGKFKIRTSGIQSGNLPPRNVNAFRTDECLWDEDNQQMDRHSGLISELNFGGGEKGLSCFNRGGSSEVGFDDKTFNEPHNSSNKKPIVIKIKSKKHPVDSSDPPDETRFSSSLAVGQNHFSAEEKPLPEIPVANKHAKSDYEQQFHVNGDDIGKAVAAMPNFEADVARRSRSFKLNATSRELNLPSRTFETGVDYLQPGTSGSSGKLCKKDTDHSSDMEQMSTSKHTISRSSRNKTEGHSSGHKTGFSGRNSQDTPKKVHWLLLSQQEEAYRYIPQLGDEVVYLRQGHQGHIELSIKPQNFPWARYQDKIRAAEVCLVENLKYTTVPGSGLSGCEITLKFIDTSCHLNGKTFGVTLPELNDYPDFIVEKTRYDAAMERNWKPGDECRVWWRDESPKGGAWWDGCIYDVRDKCSDFPGSPWESCVVRYTNDTTDHFHCPWELHDPDSLWQRPKIDFNTRWKFASSIANLLEKATKNKDRYGISKLSEVAQKSDFMNRFPVPLTPEIIQERLEKYYYRNVKATRHDIEIMLSNAESYFKSLRNSELLRKMERLSEWFDRELSVL